MTSGETKKVLLYLEIGWAKITNFILSIYLIFLNKVYTLRINLMALSFVEKQRVLLCIVWGEKKSVPKKNSLVQNHLNSEFWHIWLDFLQILFRTTFSFSFSFLVSFMCLFSLLVSFAFLFVCVCVCLLFSFVCLFLFLF